MGLYITHQDTKFQVGDTIKVVQKIVEGEKTRSQSFKGLVIKIKGHQGEKTFTVRNISSGIGVEKIWPIDCPAIEKVEVLKQGYVRRAKLYYLRDRAGRLALKVKSKRDTSNNNAVETKSTTSEPKTTTRKTRGTTGKKTSSAKKA